MKKMLFTLFTVLAVTTLSAQSVTQYHSSEVEATKEYQAGNAYQQDLLLYADMLATTHPYYADAKLRKELNREVRKSYKECATLSDVASFKLLLARLAAKLGDGHTAISYWSNMEMIFPVRMAINGDKSAIIDVTSQEYRALLGKSVTHIGGRPLKDVLAQARKIVSADNDINYENLVKDYLMFTEFWSFLDMSQEQLTLTLADGTTVDIEPIQRNTLRIAQLQSDTSNRTTAKRNVLFDYSIFDEEGICYLQFNQFADRVTLPQYKQLARFDTFIEEMMAEIEAKGVKTLVVDLQYNGGGNSMLGDVLLSWLYPIEELKRYGVDVRTSELLYSTYPYYREFTYDGKPLELGRVYDMWRFDHNRVNDADTEPQQDSTRHILNHDAKRIFRGDVIFVEGKESFSSATLLLTLARDNGIGIIVGEPSGGKPSHYGDILYCMLPNTKTIATVSHKHFVRPNREARNSDYIVPDVAIELRNAERDMLWEWVVRNYSKQRKAGTKSEDDSYLWDTIYRPAMN